MTSSWLMRLHVGNWETIALKCYCGATWVSCCHKSLAFWVFVQQFMRTNIKETPRVKGFPSQMASNGEGVSISCRLRGMSRRLFGTKSRAIDIFYWIKGPLNAWAELPTPSYLRLILNLWRHIWRDRYGSITAQVMACCLTAPSHYLNQFWLIISDVFRQLRKGTFTARDLATILYNEFKKLYF